MARAPTRRFLFDGRIYEARGRETLLGALPRGRVPLLQRSTRYHRPRGPACGLGYCTGCLVRVNDRPNVRACRYVPADGDRVATENAWPSAGFDVLGALDFLFPAGVDTLHGFRRPAWATRLYQRVVRRLAGFGAPPPAGVRPTPAVAGRHLSSDVVIVGAGASGRAAALGLIAAGQRPVVLERALEAPELPGADLHTGTSGVFLPRRTSSDGPFVLLAATESGTGIEVRARSVIVATGGYDGALLFPGNDRPGVITADGAFALAGPGGPAPFARGLVVGGGPRADMVLARFGDRVEAVVAPGPIVPSLVRRASELEVPLYPRTLVLSAEGRGHVRRLRLRSRGVGTRFALEGDAVVLAHRRLPSGQLLFQAGARMAWHGETGAYYPEISAAGETTVPGVFAVGEAAGVRPDAAGESGARAAAAILAHPAGGPDPPRVAREGPNELEGYYRELLREAPPGRWIACPCEDVLVSEIVDAHRRGYRGIEVVKRYSGVGTGLCQGRYCLPDTLLLLSLLEGRAPPEVGYITQRPPVAPVPLGAFASLAEAGAPPEAS